MDDYPHFYPEMEIGQKGLLTSTDSIRYHPYDLCSILIIEHG